MNDIKTMEALYNDMMNNLEKDGVDDKVFDPYKQIWDLDGITKIFLDQASMGPEVRAHMHILDTWNENTGNPNKVEEIMKGVIDAVNKYNLNVDDENVIRFLSKYFITKDSLTQAYIIWRKNKPIFEKSKYFVIKNGDCGKPVFEKGIKDAILSKGKCECKYIIGDDQCNNCVFNDSNHKYCQQYNLELLELLTDLLKKKEFKKMEK